MDDHLFPFHHETQRPRNYVRNLLVRVPVRWDGSSFGEEKAAQHHTLSSNNLSSNSMD